MDHDTIHDLTETIAYALWRAPGPGRAKRSLDDCRIVAGYAVEHIVRCQWQFTKMPSPIVPGLHSKT